MKTSFCILSALVTLSMFACNKTTDSASQISLSASTEQATIGETVAVNLSSTANVSRWTVTPATASKTYTLTTSKTNYITFKQAGTYTVSVSAKTLAYDSTSQSLENAWNSAKSGACVKGIDSTSIKINVVK